MRFLRVLRLPHLALLWSGQVLSAMGDFFYQIAMLWLAIKIAGSQGGIFIAGVEAAAALLFGILGGIYADRWNRRYTMLTVDILRALAVGTLPLLALYGPLALWELTLVAILVGSLGAFFNPALQASLPALVPDKVMLQATNGLMDITRRLARTFGPSLAALLITFLPLSQFFTIDAFSFLISAGAILLMGRHFAWKASESTQHTSKGLGGLVLDIRKALQAIRGHRPIAWTIFASGFISMAWSAGFIIGIPLFASQVLKGTVSAYGLIVAAYGAGNVVSNLLIGSLPLRRPVRVMLLGRLIVGGGFILMISQPSLAMAMFGAALAATGGPMGDIPLAIMMQTELPSQHIGKVYSLYDMTSSLGSILGPMLAALLYAYLTVPQAIATCGLIIAATSVMGFTRLREV
ncbi:MFS transporter [Ktedonobacter robiniae]|uniref:MFS transporter n=1 Tax=Ktedonobacter robiniae TaxID=2778365 RepID=A0ABQ3UQ88_9CHLR|nr:MFS transporter [Ktedonobacter robiniae]GHO54893.1 MFS transporter [Ktedonobacter robiniae]